MALAQTLNVTDGLGVPQTVPAMPNNLVNTVVSFSSSGDQAIVAGAAAKTVKLYRLYLSAAGPTEIEIKSSGGTVLHGPHVVQPGAPLVLDNGLYAWAETVMAEGLTINSSAAVQVSGSCLTLQS